MPFSPTQKYKPGLHSIAYVTTPNESTALELSKKLIERKLAAGVNIVPGMIAIYEWEGMVKEHQEILMMIKTRSTRADELCEFVRENHPYSVAEIVTVPIENGNPAYLTWLSKSVPEGKK